MTRLRIAVPLALIAALLASPAPAAQPEGTLAPTGTLAKIKRTGSITLGIREASYPLSYLDDQKKPVGYHIDICLRIVEAVKTRLGLPDLPPKMVAVTSQTRIPKMVDGSIDLECGSTTNNAARKKLVAFAPTTYVASVRTAVKRSSHISSLSQLNGKTVVTTTGATAVQLLKARGQGAGFHISEMFGSDHAESFHLLETDQAAAFVMDDNLLAGLIANSATPKDYEIIGETLTTEPIAIMLRKDDPAFKALVDETVKGMMKSGEVGTLYAKWFQSPIPPRGTALDFPMSAVLASLIQFPGDDPAEAFRPTE